MARLNASDFPVPPETQQTIIDKRFQQIAGQVQPQDQPVAVFIGGQPGSGKSNTISSVKKHLGSIVLADSDELRMLHPDMDKICSVDPFRMDVLSNNPVGFWMKTLIDKARQQRFHVIVENTFAQPEVISQEAKRFQDAGYQTNFIALAVPDAASRLGIVTRYIKARETAEYPRWTSEATHSNAIQGIPSTIKTLLDNNIAAEVTIRSRTGDQEHIITTSDDVHQALENIRKDYFTETVRDDWRDQYEKAIGSALEQNLVNDYTYELFGNLYNNAHTILGNDVPNNHHQLGKLLDTNTQLTPPTQRNRPRMARGLIQPDNTHLIRNPHNNHPTPETQPTTSQPDFITNPDPEPEL